MHIKYKKWKENTKEHYGALLVLRVTKYLVNQDKNITGQRYIGWVAKKNQLTQNMVLILSLILK